MEKHHLNIEERSYIQISLAQGLSLRTIATMLGRSPSNLSREVRRNLSPEQRYLAVSAQAYARQHHQGCRPRRRLVEGNALFEIVTLLLRKYYSPEQIVATIKTISDAYQKYYVCHEAIHKAIYALPVGTLRKELITFATRQTAV